MLHGEERYNDFLQEYIGYLLEVGSYIRQGQYNSHTKYYKSLEQKLLQMTYDITAGYCIFTQGDDMGNFALNQIEDFKEEELEDSYRHFHNVDKLEKVTQDNVTLRQQIEYLKKQMYLMSLKNCPVERNAILNSSLEYFKEDYK